MSVIIYWLAIRGYAAILRLASLFNSKAKAFVVGRKNLLSDIRYALIEERRPGIWMHCASLGEFEQGRPVLEALRHQHPDHALVLTFFSPSGYEAMKSFEGVDYVFYLPLDSVRNAKTFLDIVRPRLCIFVKYDLWYFYLSQIASRDIPLLLISATFRKGQLFFKWYGQLYRRMLDCFTQIFVQDAGSQQLLNRIGLDNIILGGDTRFDRVSEIASKALEIPIASSFIGNHKVIVAGSTWKADEVFLSKLLPYLPGNYKLIIVPHEVHDSHINDIENLFAGETIRWSRLNDNNKRILIVDKIGLLSQLYSYAEVAWIGGGLNSSGVHNVLEAAVYGIPVVFGPVFEKYVEANELLTANGALTTDNPQFLGQQLQNWETDRYSYEQMATSAANYVTSKTGATQKIINYVKEKNWLTVP